MRKRFLFLTLAICLCLCSCGQSAIPLTETVWKFAMVQDENGAPVAVSPALKDTYPEAAVRELSCTLDNSSFTIVDGDTSKTWSGSYAPGGGLNIYTISIDGKSGSMSSGTVTELDGRKTKKLYLSVGAYTLSFEA